MRRYLQRLLLIAALCVPWAMGAQETLTVADGTNTSTTMPVYQTWMDSQPRTQLIYPEGRLVDMIGSEITKIKFYYNTTSTPGWSAQDLTIRLGIVDDSVFSSNTYYDTTGMTVVYTGLFPNNNGECELVFTTPFEYNGGNLLFAINDNVSGGSYSPTVPFKGKTTASGTKNGLYSYSTSISSTNFLPKITFTYEAGGCGNPRNFVVTAQTSSSVSFIWNKSKTGLEEGTGYQYVVVPADSTPSWTSPLTTTDTFCTVSGLAANTAYDLWIRSNCGTEQSRGTVFSFRTGCEAMNILPYSCNFDDSPAGSSNITNHPNFAFCWSRYEAPSADAAYRAYPYIYSGANAYSGTNAILFNVATSYNANYPASEFASFPQIAGSIAPSGLRVSFYARTSSTTSTDMVVVGVMTDPHDTTTFAPCDTVMVTGNTYHRYFASLASYSDITGGDYVTLRVRRVQTGGSDLYVDDAALETMPTCFEPLNPVATGTIYNSTSLSWTPQGTETEWRIQWRHVDSTEWNTVTGVTTNPYTVTGFDGLNEYELRVAAVCGSNVSGYSEVLTISTPCAPVNVTEDGFEYNFDNSAYNGTSTTSDFTIQCWHRLHNSTSTYIYPYQYSYASYAHSSPGLLYFYLSTTASYASSQFAVLPEVAEDVNTLRMAFYARVSVTGIKFVVGVMTDPTDSTTFVGVDTIQYTVTGSYTRTVVDFADYVGTGKYIAIKLSREFSATGYLYLDDVSLSVKSSCPTPTGLVATAASPETIQASWNAAAGATSYSVRLYESSLYNPENPDQNAMITINAGTDTSILLTGYGHDETTDMDITVSDQSIRYNHEYVVVVRANCGTTPADWSAGVKVSTPFDCDGDAYRDITVGTGTTNSSASSMGYTYLSSSYLRSFGVQLLTGAELKDMDIYEGDIRSVAWFMPSGAALNNVPMRIYMAHTDTTGLAVADTGRFNPRTMQLVWQGNMNWRQDQWLDFELTTPFHYAGTDSNLVIRVEIDTCLYRMRATGETGTYSYIRTTSRTGRSLYSYTSTSQYCYSTANFANVRLKMCVEEPYCFRLLSLKAEAIEDQPTAVRLTWKKDPRDLNNQGFLIFYGPDTLEGNPETTLGFTDYTGLNPIAATDTTCVVTGLNSNSQYRFFIQSYCGAVEDGVSEFVESNVVRTTCAPQEWPYTIGFERTADELSSSSSAANFGVYCWNRLTNYNRPYAYSSSSYAHEGTYSLYWSFDTIDTNYAIAVLPEMEESLDEAQMVFWARTNAGDTARLIFCSIIDDSLASLEPFDTVLVIGSTMTEYNKVLANISLPTGYERLALTVAKGDVLWLDDITVREDPGTLKPKSFAIVDGSLSQFGADFVFVDVDNSPRAPQYQIGIVSGEEWDAEDEEMVLINITRTDDNDTVYASATTLDPNVRYVAAVRAINPNQENEAKRTSEWSDPTPVFTTLCEPISAAELPYYEGFENVYSKVYTSYNATATASTPGVTYALKNSDVSCWDFAVTEGTPMAYIGKNATYRYDGDQYLVLASNSAQAYAYAVLPIFDNPVEYLRMSFYYRNHSTTSSNYALELGYVTNNQYDSTFVKIADFPVNNTYQFVDYIFNMDTVAVPNNANVRLAFRARYYSVYIDSITVFEAPACQYPRYFAATGENTAYTMPLRWVNSDLGADGIVRWDVMYIGGEDTLIRSIDADVDNDSVIRLQGQIVSCDTVWTDTTHTEYSLTNIVREADTMAFVLPNLNANTTYTLRIRSVGEYSGETFVSDWSQPISSALTRTLSDATDIIVARATYPEGVWVETNTDTATREITVTVDYGTPLNAIKLTLLGSPSNTGIYIDNMATPFSDTISYNFVIERTIIVRAEDTNITGEWTLIVEPELCTYPRNIAFSNIARRTFTASWQILDSRIYQYDIWADTLTLTDEALDTLPFVTVNDTTYNFEGLRRAHTYNVYVRAHCSNGELSRWAVAEVTTEDMPCSAESQPIIIGTATTTSKYLPMTTNYNYGYGQMLFKASELGQTGKINKISFNVSALATSTSYEPHYIFYVALTDLTELTASSYVPASELTQVGVVTEITQTGWYDIDLPEDIVIDGTKNLVIAVANQSGVWSGGPNFYYSSSSGTVVERHNDSYSEYGDPFNTSYALSATTYRPNIKFGFCIPGDPCPAVDTLYVEKNLDDPTEVTLHWTAEGDYASLYHLYVITDTNNFNPDSSTGYIIVNNADSVVVEELDANTQHFAYLKVFCQADGIDDGSSNWVPLTFKTNSYCRVPENVVMTKTGKKTVNLTYDFDATQAANYRYIVSTSVLTDNALETATPTMAHIDTNDINIELPEYSTFYHIYIGNDCGGTDGVSPYYYAGTVRTSDACPAPENLKVTEIDVTGALVTWKPAQFTDETTWQVNVTGTGVNQTFTVTDTFAVVTGLMPEQNYTVSVSTMCNETPGTAATRQFTTIAYVPCTQIGEGTSAYYYVPSSGYYHYSYTQTVFTPGELNNVGEIASIAYNYIIDSGTVHHLDIYMGTTAGDVSSAFATVTNFRHVFSGLHHFTNANGGWSSIALDSTFTYDGSANLVIAVYRNNVGETNYGSTARFGYHSATGMTRYRQSDSEFQIAADGNNSGTTAGTATANRPNMKICFNNEFGGCLPVTHLVTRDITTNSVTASWYKGGTETSWEYVNVGLGSDGDASATTDSALNANAQTTTNYTLTINNLEPDHAYTLYVRPVCTDTAADQPAWRAVSYMTKISCYAPNAVDTWRNTDVPEDSIDYRHIALIARHTDSVNNNLDLENFEYQVWPYANPQAGDTVTFLAGDSVTIGAERMRPGYFMAWRVRGICQPGDSSRWVQSYASIFDSLTLPYYENFNQNNTVTRMLWRGHSDIDDSTATYPNIAATSYYYIRFHSGESTTNISHEQYAVGPIMRDPVNTMMLTFHAWQSSTASAATKTLILGYPANDTTFVPIDTLEVTATAAASANLFEYYLDELPDSIHRIAFKWLNTGTATYQYTYVDDVTLDTLPACRKPVDFAVAENNKAYAATLKWRAINGEQNWLLRYRASADTVDTDLNIAAADATLDEGVYYYELTGLNTRTAYVANIYSLCGEDTSLVANNTVRFTTLSDTAYIQRMSIASPAGAQIGNAVFDHASKRIDMVLRAGEDITDVALAFVLNPASGTYMMWGNDTVVSGDNSFDFTYGQLFTVYPPAADAQPFNWNVYVTEEACPSIYDLRVTDLGRSYAELEWKVGQAASMAAPQTQFVLQLKHNAEVLSTDTITVEADSIVRAYRLEGIHRATNYTVSIKSVCKDTWSQSVDFTTPDLPCDPTQGGEPITIGTGTGTSRYFAGSCYYNYGATQFLFTASELGSALPINKFYVHVSTPDEDYLPDYQIYMANTTRTSLAASTYLTASELTYVGSFASAIVDTGWLEIPLENTFNYDGTSNLVIAMFNQTGEYSSSLYINYTSASGKGLYRYDDDEESRGDVNTGGNYTATSYRPNIRFEGCVPVAPCVAPEGLTVQLTGEGTTSAAFTWQRPDNDGDSIYRAVVLRADDTVEIDSLTVFNYEGNGLGFSVDTLVPYTDYVVYVMSVCGNGDGNSPTWSEQTFRTNSTCRTPSNLVATLTGKNQVTLTWDGDNTEDTTVTLQANNFSVIVSYSPVENFDSAVFDTTGLDATTYVIDGLAYTDTVYIYIANVCEDGSYSPFVGTSIVTAEQCAAPVNFAASEIGLTGARLSWERGYMSDETQWMVHLTDFGLIDTTYVVDTNSFVVTSLYTDMDYEATLSYVCGEDTIIGDTIEFHTLARQACMVVGTGTSGAAYLFGANTNYKYGYGQSLYTAEEIGNTGTVSSIAFKVTSAATAAYNANTNYTVYMALTNLTTLSASDFVPYSSLTQVATITDMGDTGWYEITLPDPIELDGTQNVVIAVANNTTEYSGHPNFSYTSVTGMTVYRQSDGTPAYGDPTNVSYAMSTTSTRTNVRFCFDLPEESDCGAAVSNLAFSGSTDTTATFSWYSGARETEWVYYVVNAETDEVAIDTAIAYTSNLTVTGLEANNDYVFYVAPNCADSVDAWSHVAFSTVYNCFQPIAAVATVDTTANTVTFTVTNDSLCDATTFIYTYWPVGADSLAVTVTAGNNYQPQNLLGFTRYQWNVRAVCSENARSKATAGNNFNTFGTLALPYVEDFEDANGIWNYWVNNVLEGPGTYGFGRYTTAGTLIHAGAASYCLRDQGSSTDITRSSWVSPEFYAEPGTNYIFSVWIYRGNYSTLKPNEGIHIWTSADNTLDANDNELMYIHREYTLDPAVEETGWYQYSALLPTSGAQRIIFEGISEYGAATYFDDLVIRPLTAADYATVTLLTDSLGTVYGDTTVFLGTEVTIGATAAEHYQFNKWSDGNTDNPRVIRLTKDTVLTAEFVPYQHLVSAEPDDVSHGIITGTGRYAYMTTATLLARAARGYEFYMWSDSITDNPRELLVESDTSLVAIFGLKRAAVDVITLVGTDTAQIAGITGTGRYLFGDSVTLTATDVHGFNFIGWADDDQDTLEATRTFIMGASDTSFTAIYDTAEFTLTLLTNNDSLGTVTGAGTYKYMRQVTISAVATGNNYFSQWSDGNANATRTISIDSNITLTAIFSEVRTHMVTLNANSAQGTVEGAGTYNEGTTVTVTATPNYGYIFAGWSDSSMNNPYSFVLTQDTILTANFVFDTFTVTVQSNNGTMGTVSESQRVNYTGSVTIAAYPAAGHRFVMWDDSVQTNPRTITNVTENMTFTAIFATKQFTINALAINGTVEGTGTYDFGTTATLVATANTGYHFAGWADDTANAFTATRNVEVDTNHIFTALFEPNVHTIALSSADTNMGTVNFSDSTTFFSAQVVLHAKAKHGYEFNAWNDGNTDSIRVINVADSNYTFVASFKARKFHVTTTVNNTAMGSVTGAGDYDYNTDAEITAIPNEHFDFLYWSDDNTLTDATRTIRVVKDTTIRAIFAPQRHRLQLTVNDTTLGSVAVTGTNVTDTTVAYNSSVSVTATPVTGYHLAYWSDDTTNTRATRNIIVTEDMTVTAVFAIDYYTLALEPNRAERVDTLIGGGRYAYNTTATIEAEAAEGYYFRFWVKYGTTDTIYDNPATVTITANTRYIAHFDARPATINVSVNDAAMGVALINDSLTTYTTIYGQQVNLKAVAFDGYRFVNWSDADTNAVRVYVLNSDSVNLTANFELIPPTTGVVTLNVSGNGNGEVFGAGEYNLGDTITIIARPAAHSHFVTWSDGVTDTLRTLVVVSDTTITAEFVLDQHTVTLLAVCDSANMTVPAELYDGAGIFDFNTMHTITARSNEHFHFVKWVCGTVERTDSVVTFMVTSDTTFTAVYEYVSGGSHEGIDDVEEGLNVDIYAAEGQIFVRGAEQHMVYVYDAVGRLVMSQKANAELVAMPMRATGVYVVKVDGAAARRVAVVR
ncbi:MAG: fibronectin type III domain-containing protein [Bacteroidales bacterium]|nr:fibronectin type III domain-containing protein [Bacteroidales bacterium]